jgi:hypothetical protein
MSAAVTSSRGPVGQQLAAAPAAPLQAGDDRLDLLVGDGLLALDGALGRVLEHQLILPDADMITADRRQPERAVLSGVLLAAGPEEAQVDQAQRGGQDPLAAQPAAAELFADRLAQPRQCRAELQHPVVLALILFLAPVVVVAVLAAARRVGADRLDVAAGVRADPDLLPGRRDDQGLNPDQRRLVGDRPGVRAEVAEPPAAPLPAVARPGQVAARQVGRR